MEQLTKNQAVATSQRSEERFSRNAETDLVCRLLLEKKKSRRCAPIVCCCLFSRCPDQQRLHSFPTRRSSDLMLKVSRLKLPVIWLLVSMWLNTLTKSQIWTLLLKV